MLHTAPSLDVYTSTTNEATKVEVDGELQRSVTIGDRIDALANGDFSFGESESDMGLIQEESEADEVEELETEVVEFMVAGGDDGFVLAESFKKQAELLLSNGDLQGAEDYFYKSIEASPHDGEAMSQYAKLLWQLHSDQDGALKYFKRAVLAAPDNSDVLGAYAGFLWETEGDEDEDNFVEEPQSSSTEPLHTGTDIEQYYKKMVEENSSDPLFLKTYSQFLYQVKQDFHGAEKYYALAIQANLKDGEIMSQYAKLIWELHRDQAKAVLYFERAVELAPGDCHVAAAYASLLWELGEDEDEDEGDHVAQS